MNLVFARIYSTFEFILSTAICRSSFSANFKEAAETFCSRLKGNQTANFFAISAA